MKITFEAKAGGDCECFCWLVTKKEFIRMTGEKPTAFDKQGKFYRIYPGVIFNTGKKYKVTISLKEISHGSQKYA